MGSFDRAFHLYDEDGHRLARLEQIGGEGWRLYLLKPFASVKDDEDGPYVGLCDADLLTFSAMFTEADKSTKVAST